MTTSYEGEIHTEIVDCDTLEEMPRQSRQNTYCPQKIEKRQYKRITTAKAETLVE